MSKLMKTWNHGTFQTALKLFPTCLILEIVSSLWHMILLLRNDITGSGASRLTPVRQPSSLSYSTTTDALGTPTRRLFSKLDAVHSLCSWMNIPPPTFDQPSSIRCATALMHTRPKVMLRLSSLSQSCWSVATEIQLRYTQKCGSTSLPDLSPSASTLQSSGPCSRDQVAMPLLIIEIY